MPFGKGGYQSRSCDSKFVAQYDAFDSETADHIHLYHEALKPGEYCILMKTSFQQYLKNAAELIETALALFAKKTSAEAASINPKLKHLFAAFGESLQGGKRIRGALVKLGYDMTGQPSEEIIKPALSYEVFQTAILAHDDIIDKSPLRRGVPSLYTKLGGDHYGISQAICLGDIGIFAANQLILESGFEASRLTRALKSFTQTQYLTVVGELIDVDLPRYKKEEITLEDIISLYEYKTAHYTIIGPLHLGAILGGADEKLLTSLQDFGRLLGIAFQIKDDILGIFGNADKTGKSIQSDIAEGKITILWYHAFAHASEEQKQELLQSYGVAEPAAKDVKKVQEIFTDTKALSISEEMMNDYVAQAGEMISKLGISKEYQEILEQMCGYLTGREK